jgi:predicted Kef-type K+ transport protein
VGVLLAIGAAIVLQSLLFPAKMFLPGVVPVTIVAVLIGWALSWLLGWTAYRILPGLSHTSGMQVMLIFSTFTSLLETILFFQGW